MQAAFVLPGHRYHTRDHGTDWAIVATMEDAAPSLEEDLPHRYLFTAFKSSFINPSTGQDLAGNTYWEFKDALNSNRYRRIVRYTKRTQHSDAAVTPQWHQWLRHTRADPPSLQEQAADISRQAQLKHNAALADARWAAKAKYIEKPTPPPDQLEDGLPALEHGRARAARPDEVQKSDTHRSAVNPGSDYQPDSWSPGSSRR